MFLDLAVLVESQGEMIDRIEFSVESSHAYVEKARKSVQTALVYKKKARSKKVCIIVGVVIVAGLITIIVLAKYLK